MAHLRLALWPLALLAGTLLAQVERGEAGATPRPHKPDQSHVDEGDDILHRPTSRPHGEDGVTLKHHLPVKPVKPEHPDEGDDILYTPDQKAAKLARKAIANLAYRWTEASDGFPDVPYTFKDAYVNQDKIEAAVQHWRDHTCINFRKVGTSQTGPHLIFQYSSGGCNSYVGMSYYWFPNGQPINIPDWCEDSFGSLVHEIGHAMGMFHEQSRSDRDDHVTILKTNIDPGAWGNFEKENDNNYGVPYDYNSDMHYGSTAFSINGKMTIQPKDPRFIPVIGQRTGLSHMDKLLANTMYDCTTKWLDACSLSSDPCQNYGYIGADCNCVCPPGSSGTNCETVTTPYQEINLSSYSEKITSAGTITSPNHPSPYPMEDFIKWIKAPECYTIQATFTAFDMYAHSTCYYDTLEIRSDNMTLDGDIYCGTGITPGTVFTSTGNEMILIHTSYTDWMNGWSADIVFLPGPDCETGPDPETTTTAQPMTSTAIAQPTTTTQTAQPMTTTTTAEPMTTTTTEGPNGCGLPFLGDDVTLTSLNFPGRYPETPVESWENCLIPLRGPVKLTFNAFRLLKGDFLEIETPFNKLKIGGKKKPRKMVIVPSSTFRATFPTHKTRAKDIGFNITFTNLNSGCNGEIDASIPQTLATPTGKGSYCEWVIQASPGKRVKVTAKKLRALKKNKVYINPTTSMYSSDDAIILTKTSAPVNIISDNEVMRIYYEGRGRIKKALKLKFKEV